MYSSTFCKKNKYANLKRNNYSFHHQIQTTWNSYPAQYPLGCMKTEDVTLFQWYSLNFETLIDTTGSYTDWNSLVLRILKFEKQLDY